MIFNEIILKVDIYDLDSLRQLNVVKAEIDRSNFEPILLNDQIYIFGGSYNSQTCERYKYQNRRLSSMVPNFRIFSFSTSTFGKSSLKPMQYGRYAYSATIMGGKIYVAGGKGHTDSTILCSVECYDPISGIWKKIANMNFPRAYFALIESKGMLYAIGHHKVIERYDPVRDVWTEVRKKLEFV